MSQSKTTSVGESPLFVAVPLNLQSTVSNDALFSFYLPDLPPVVSSQQQQPSSTHRSHTVTRQTNGSAAHLSFKSTDEFFHGMLSYRVRTEGPPDKGGNNLARLIYDACSDTVDIQREKENKESSNTESVRHFSQSLEKFGKWPKAFSRRSERIRLFLDQENLRMGLPWKGTGDADSGGFLGAVSQALVLVPLFSATPVLFKLKVVSTGMSQRYALESPINMKLENGVELLSIQADQLARAQAFRTHVCQDVRGDGTFMLSAISQDVSDDFPSRFYFWCSANVVPADGSGARGSLADMLYMLQKPEELTFSVKSVSDGCAILQVDQLTDHLFFSNETISLQTSDNARSSASGSCTSFRVVQVICQGSKAGDLLSTIKIEVGEHLACFSSASSCIPGTTQEIDRCDNFLMELMLCRALRTLSATGNLHPCKLIMPVFVDDMDTLCPLSDRLSDKNSKKTSDAVGSALVAILKRELDDTEVEQWIDTPVNTVVKFYFEFQGLQLSDKSNRCKSMADKASLVRAHFVYTAGIEANNNALFQYVSNNPLAHELLDFLDNCGLIHLHPVLVKHDITSVKEFSQLSQGAIDKIAHDGHELSTRPLLKESVEISCAVSAAVSSKFILPVSKRLELFEDKEASFLTVIYSSYAIYLALQKPFFSFVVQLIYLLIPLYVASVQIYQDAARNMPYIIPNLTRVLWMMSAMTFYIRFWLTEGCFSLMDLLEFHDRRWVFGWIFSRQIHRRRI
jgi:hypothetical protein